MAVTDLLVDFITAPVSPPPDVTSIVDLCLLDWASVTIAGRDEPVAQLVRVRAEKEGGQTEAQVCGLTQRLPARATGFTHFERSRNRVGLT